MGEEKKEVEKKEQPKKPVGKASKMVEFLGKVLKLFENIHKAVAGIAIIISLVAGGTGAWGSYVGPASKDVKELKKQVHDLQIWNEALRERTKALIGSGDSIEFDGYMLDLDSGEIDKLSPRQYEVVCLL